MMDKRRFASKLYTSFSALILFIGAYNIGVQLQTINESNQNYARAQEAQADQEKNNLKDSWKDAKICLDYSGRVSRDPKERCRMSSDFHYTNLTEKILSGLGFLLSVALGLFLFKKWIGWLIK